MRTAIALALTGLLAAPAAAQEQQGHEARVVLSRTAASPAALNVLAGDRVVWFNGSSRTHTVTSSAGHFDARVTTGRTFTHPFDAVGDFGYYCRLHPAITGRVAVRRLLIDEAPATAVRGETVRIAGRAASGIGRVTVEADTGSGFAEIAQAGVDEHGVFAADVQPAASGDYRVAAGGERSDARSLVVSDVRQLSLTGTLRRARAVRVARAEPAKPGARVVLQLRLRERFGWWPVRWARLDERSRARFSYPRNRSADARVVMVGRDGATVLSASRTYRIRRSRKS